MIRRPLLHEIGSLKTGAKVNFVRETVTLGATFEKAAVKTVEQWNNGAMEQSTSAALLKVREVSESFEDDAAPVAVLDEAIDSEVLIDSVEVVAKPQAAPKPLAETRMLTAADRIEAACAKLDISVRAYIEDELKARFVGVWKLGVYQSE